jgi:two-component system, LytTR family, response regulator
MQMIRVIIIDDELKSCQNLEKLLQEFCDNVEVMALCQSVDAGIEAIHKHKPDLVFLDVQMKGETGFDLLSKIDRVNFEIVFATAYSEYAIKAFRFSAIDYLLKPIDIDDLRAAVGKVGQKKNSNDITGRIEQLIANLKPSTPQQYKLAIPSSDGLVFVMISDILYCEASGNYTTFYIADQKKYIVSRTLKEYEEMLTDSNFVRIHNSYVVNINAIKKYIRGDGGQVVMSNNTVLDVSKRKKEAFLKAFPH